MPRQAPRIDNDGLLISRAVGAAPDRPDLIWLNIGACMQVESCKARADRADNLAEGERLQGPLTFNAISRLRSAVASGYCRCHRRDSHNCDAYPKIPVRRGDPYQCWAK